MKHVFVPLESFGQVWIGILVSPTEAESGYEACVAALEVVGHRLSVRPFPGRDFADALDRAREQVSWFLENQREIGEYFYDHEDIVIADLVL